MPKQPGAWPQQSLAGISLPAGKLVTGEDGETPLVWMANTAGVSLGVWQRLVDAFPATGLCSESSFR